MKNMTEGNPAKLIILFTIPLICGNILQQLYSIGDGKIVSDFIDEYAFAGCHRLRTIHLPSNIRKISKGMFFGCSSLTKCFLSDEIEWIEDDAFKGCTAMRKPWIPKNIKKISETAFDNPAWSKM